MNGGNEIREAIKKGRDKIIQAYDMLPNYCLGQDVPELLTGLRDAMKNYVELEAKWQDSQAAKERIVREITNRASDREEEVTHDEICAEMKRSNDTELSKRPANFWESDENFASLRDLTQEDDEEAQEEVDGGEEIAVTRMAIQTIDPYTKQEFVDPVKNVRCNHSYERETITNLLTNKQNLRCYYMGCNNRNPIRMQDLVDNEELKRHMARLRARAAF